MGLRLLVFLLLVIQSLGCCAQTGTVSPDKRWKIEITEERPTNLVTGNTSIPHVRLILHDLLTKQDQVALDKTDYWLPGPRDAAEAVWRRDSRAVTLPDSARKWSGFCVYVLVSQTWRRADQSNDFLDEISRIWNLKQEQFDAAQQGGSVSNLKWSKGGSLQFKFWSFPQTDTFITEKLINENDKPQVIFSTGSPDKMAVPPLVAMLTKESK